MRRRKRRRKRATWNTKWSDSWNEDENILEDDEFDLDVFRLDMVSIIGKSMGNFSGLSNDWNKLDDDEKIDLMVSTKGKKNYRWTLSNCLDKTLNKVLLRFYDKYFDPLNMSKKTRINELIAVFYDEESPLDKRKEESSNIEAIGDLEKEFRFIELLEILVPGEVMTIVFSYLERDFTVLTRIGATCQFFYVKLLTTWGHINISRSNLHKISLLALKSTNSIRYSQITQVEQEYMWKYLSNKRLRKIEINDSPAYIRSALSFILQKVLKKKKSSISPENYPAQNVTELVLAEHQYGKVKMLDSSYNTIFPNLTKLTSNFNREFLFRLLKGCDKIREFGITGNNSSGWSWNNPQQHSNDRITNFKKYFDHPKRIRTIGIDQYPPSDQTITQFVSQLLSFFEGVESISIEFKTALYGYGWYGGGTAPTFTFDMEKIFEPVIQDDSDKYKDSFKKISIIDNLENEIHQYENMQKNQIQYVQQYGYAHNTGKIVSVVYSNDLKNVEEIELRTIPRNYTFVESIDFNVEELMESNFLLDNSRLRVFLGDMPLGKKSRIISVEQDKIVVMRKYIDEIIPSFLRFVTDSMVNERYDRFEITIRSGDIFFSDELFSLKYDRKKIDGSMNHFFKRIDVKYAGKNQNVSKPFGNGIVTKKKKKKKSESDTRIRGDDDDDESDNDNDDDDGNILEDVVICISLIGNPERSEIRKKATELGASYSPHLSDKVTHLICPSGSTYQAPKIREALENDLFVVSKDWILDCEKMEKRILITPKYGLFDSKVEEEQDDDDDDEEEEEEEDDDEILDEDEDVDRILMKDRRPCSLLFQEFLKVVRDLAKSDVDLFHFGVYKTSMVKRIWGRKIEEILRINSEAGLEKYTFDATEMIMTKMV